MTILLPKHVTFTGLDQHTDPVRLVELSARYPIEWGILFSKRNSGKVSRYPALDATMAFRGLGLSLSAHLCGSWSENAVTLGVIDPMLDMAIKGRFKRVQFNLDDGETWVLDDPDPFRLSNLAEQLGAERAIVQCTRPEFPSQPAVDWLFDRSGGAGVESKFWPALPPITGPVGYAGGIGPDNIVVVLEAITETHDPARPFWIDMESRIRTDEWLDLDKCEAVCRGIWGEAAPTEREHILEAGRAQ